eukprot:g8446.t1
MSQEQHLQHSQRKHDAGIIRGGGAQGTESSDGLVGVGIDRSSSSLDESNLGSREGTIARDPADRVLILDVDGTLYGQSSGVEQQIVDGIHRYFGEELGLCPAECNDIHHRYGSTVWGLQKEGRLSEDQIAGYYQEVFASVSVDGLNDGGLDHDGDMTGYQHRANAALMIRAHRGPVFVASNSPLPHVRRVLEGVGLGDVPFAGILTPDTRGWLTKSSPEFYDTILEHDSVKGRGVEHGDLWLLDDSVVNLEVASRIGFRTVLVTGDAAGGVGGGALPLERALACFVGAIPHPDEWLFSDSEYLRSKNAVDKVSRSKDVWKRLEEEVLALGLGAHDSLRVADLGCGLLPLLQEFRSLAKACGVQRLEYCGLEKEEGVAKEACEGLLSEGYTFDDREGNGNGAGASSPGGEQVGVTWRLSACHDHESGLAETSVRIIPADFTSVDPAALFPQSPRQRGEEGATAVAARTRRLPHVLVGCCLADLLEPGALMRALKRLAGVGGECLVYLPITFVGKTSMTPSAPQEGLLPGDDAVLQAYDDCLREQQGHYTCLNTLLQTIREHGAHTMISSPSPWRVSFDGADRYMWQCLLYFIGLGLAPYPLPLAESSDTGASDISTGAVAQGEGWGTQQQQKQHRSDRSASFSGWVRRARERKPMLQADNVDLLFQLRGGGGDAERGVSSDSGRQPRQQQQQQQQPSSGVLTDAQAAGSMFYRGGGRKGASPGGEAEAGAAAVKDNAFLEFVAPGRVKVRHEELDGEKAVGEGQVLVQAICSSISSGTELKVFRGDFDSDSELDTTIKGMAGESMSYPLRYGYSLVGRVAKCGEGVDSEKYLGKLVFAFSPHSSWVLADADGVMLVPEGIEPEDAVYLPAVETALSLVHDVHPRVGEKVAVFGQGMIGLLAVSILAKTHGGVGGSSVVAVDMIAERLRVAERLGATAAVTPADAATRAPFDISLEVTGNPRGLQSALDLTGYGGRVVLGSWYGGGAAQLNLGMAFHRSHLTIQTSQVSRLPAGLTDRWDKERRFATAWSLVRELRPSAFLTTSSTPLGGAQGAYESLGAGSELGVVFRY